MFEPNEVVMVVAALANGKFAVNAVRSNALNQQLGVFDTRTEAEAWILQRTMAEDEAANGTGILKPGDGQAVG